MSARGYLPRGCLRMGVSAIPPCGQTDDYENITLPQTSFVDGKYMIDFSLISTQDNTFFFGVEFSFSIANTFN